MASKEWTDDEVEAGIADAVKIVREDREKAEYVRLHGLYGNQPDPDDKGNNPPPKKKDDPEPKKSRSLWWGESLDG